MIKRLFPAFALAYGASAGLAGCHRDSSPVAEDGDQGRIDFVRNSSFAGGHLAVFLVLENGEFRTVHSLTDVYAQRPFETPIPGHDGTALTFLKVDESGTSMAHASLSWDSEDPDDYLMAGWWAEFPGQHPPVLSLAGSERYAIVDGSEMTPLSRPQFPAGGSASYVGSAGGLYAYGDDENVIDEYQGVINLQVDFADRTLEGCIGCLGGLGTGRAHFSEFLGEEVIDTGSFILDRVIHLGALEFDELTGQFSGAGAPVVHPDLEIVESDGDWGGQLSERPDAAGLPRLAAGFSSAGFLDENGVEGVFVGTFVAWSPASGAE